MIAAHMKDTNQSIRYQGFQFMKDGGRELQFSLDESKDGAASNVTIAIAGSFFSGPGGITFQEAASICTGKLRHDRGAEAHPLAVQRITLTTADVSQFREVARGRRRS